MNPRILHFWAVLACFCLVTTAFAQDTAPSTTISGVVRDAGTGDSMIGVNVRVNPASDTTQVFGGVTNPRGFFSIPTPRPGAYRVRISYVGYQMIEEDIEVGDRGYSFGILELQEDVMLLDRVVVEGVQERVEQRGDTTVYNADAFKVNPDATTEDLLRKMPGVTVEDGNVQARGEQVQRVLIDGREFFGNDPTLAIRSLPAEIIEKIEVFDKQSEQSEFTGFDDGNAQRTINIITRSGSSNGQFGKSYGGYGSDVGSGSLGSIGFSDARYIAGGNLNVFDGDRRISIIGMSNNVNQQNFSTEDLLGVVGNTRSRGGGGSFRGGSRGGDRGGRGGRSGGGSVNDFLVGAQGGENTSHAFGVNYTDSWGSKTQVTGSYFFNASDNTSNVLLDREYLLGDDLSQLYAETDNSTSDNMNHRLNMRIQHELDDRNSFIFRPSISLQNNEALSQIFGANTLDTGALLSTTTNNYVSNSLGYNSSNSLLWRHRLPKQGRTISVNASLSFNSSDGDTELFSSNLFEDPRTADLIVDQQTNNDQSGTTLAAYVSYTEPLGERGQLQFSYRPSVTNSDADQRALTFDDATQTYSILDESVSNVFSSRTLQQRGGLSYRLRQEKGFAMLRFDVQHTTLTGDQAFPVAFGLERTFFDVLPMAMYQYRWTRTKNIRLFYRTNTNTPSITQLQNVIDNTNPLQLSSGNPDLVPSYSHTGVARYSSTDPEGGRVFFALGSFSATNNTIGTSSLIAQRDTVLTSGVVLSQGSQFSQPVNVGTSWNARTLLTVGLPVTQIKSNANLSAGYNYTRSPGLINNVTNTSGTHNVSSGIVLGSNISERVDFTLDYALNYSVVENTVYPDLDADYVFHRYGAKVNLLPFGKFVLDTQLTATSYVGLGESIDDHVVLWNAGLGYKFLRGNGGELKLMVADILNQNTNIVRTVNELYIEDNVSNVLGRYVLLNFTYTLRNFRR